MREDQKKNLSFGRVLLISIITSLIITILYLTIETVCVKTGKNMPYQKTYSGGECIEYVGVFWNELILCPLTSMDDPPYREEPQFTFKYISLIKIPVLLTLCICCVLCLFTKYRKVVAIAVGGILLIIASAIGIRKLVSVINEKPKELCSITVITSDIHEGTFYSLEYPGDASYLVAPGEDGPYGKAAYEKIPASIPSERVSKKQLNALIEATKDLSNASEYAKSDFMYYVKLTYRKNKGYGYVYARGYNRFPPEWAEFARLTNEICGEEYLREKPDPIYFSTQWFSKTYGIYDEDMPEGASIEGFLESQYINMQTICGKNSTGDYYHFDPEPRLKNYLSFFVIDN